MKRLVEEAWFWLLEFEALIESKWEACPMVWLWYFCYTKSDPSIDVYNKIYGCCCRSPLNTLLLCLETALLMKLLLLSRGVIKDLIIIPEKWLGVFNSRVLLGYSKKLLFFFLMRVSGLLKNRLFPQAREVPASPTNWVSRAFTWASAP